MSFLVRLGCNRCYEKSLLTFGNVADAVSPIVIGLILIATFNGLFEFCVRKIGGRYFLLGRNVPEEVLQDPHLEGEGERERPFWNSNRIRFTRRGFGGNWCRVQEAEISEKGYCTREEAREEEQRGALSKSV